MKLHDASETERRAVFTEAAAASSQNAPLISRHYVSEMPITLPFIDISALNGVILALS